MKITVLKGGWSAEREISLLSAANVSTELRELGHDVYELDVKKDLRHITDELYRSAPDFVFNVLHGIGGEDGTIQGILDVFGVPYSNCDVLSSAVTFHKPTCKKLVESAGIRVIEGFEIHKEDIQKINESDDLRVNYPFVIKPAANGSSVGVFLIFNKDDLETVKETEWTFGDEVIVEKYIKGREFTTLVVNGKMIGALEIKHKNKFYDYSSKYDDGGSEHISDFRLDEYSKREMRRMSEAAFAICRCRDFVRMDFRFDGEYVYFMELNAQPGMTATSLVPDIARAEGLSMKDILNESLKQNVRQV